MTTEPTTTPAQPKAYRADCPSCGRPIGASLVGDGSKAKLLRHKDFTGGEGWCAGSDTLTGEFTEVQSQGRKARKLANSLPRGKDGAKYSPVCAWCGDPIDPVTYWRGIDPDLPPGGFRAVCGEACTGAAGREVLEQAGPRWGRKHQPKAGRTKQGVAK